MFHRQPLTGEPAPWFVCATADTTRFHFDTVAGRHVVLCFHGSAGMEITRRTLAAFGEHAERFDAVRCCFFAVSIDPADAKRSMTRELAPGMRLFHDHDCAVSELYGACDPAHPGSYRPRTFVLDERLRVVGVFPFGEDPDAHVAEVMSALDGLPPVPAEDDAETPAPVLVVPRVFEPSLCRELIDHYGRHGGQVSGFMREIDGMTVSAHDPQHKRRRDQTVLDESLRQACMHRIHDRLAPEVRRAFQFSATRIERYLVACYDSHCQGFFRAHRDNTTRGTAHRRFAVSINLNAGEYEGGRLRFPEYGRRSYAPPTGGALVFSCSLMHEATPVTVGRRFVFLPFLYDEAAAQQRAENQRFLADGAAATAGHPARREGA
jgi:peroxiredoxin/predicted 2-oxoglutarate/Fe(II)-dependent dioxygenase YbiX